VGDDVLGHDLGVLHRVSGHLGLGDIGDVAELTNASRGSMRTMSDSESSALATAEPP